MENIYQYKNISFELKDLDTKEGIVKGYFSAFNVKDSDGDIILPGAFTKSIKERGPQSQRPRIKWLIDHDTTQVPGVIKELSEDSYGLAYVGKVGNHALGQDFFKMVESGIITEHSIGFKTVEEKKKDDANYMHVLYLMEGSSLKAWGANEHTPITGFKSDVEIAKIQNRIKRLEKFCTNSDATDETIESLLIEVKQLSQLLLDINSSRTTQTAAKASAPEKELNTKGILALLEIQKQLITN